MSVIDIARAYFNARIERDVFVELPPEAGDSESCDGKLKKCLYCARGEAQGWAVAYRLVLVNNACYPSAFYMTIEPIIYFSWGPPSARHYFLAAHSSVPRSSAQIDTGRS